MGTGMLSLPYALLPRLDMHTGAASQGGFCYTFSSGLWVGGGLSKLVNTSHMLLFNFNLIFNLKLNKIENVVLDGMSLISSAQ